MQPDQQKIELIKQEVDEFLYDYQDVKITTANEYTGAGDLLKQLQLKVKKVEEKRKEYTKPLDDLKKKIMDDFRQITDPLEQFITDVKVKMTDWYRLEQKRKDEEQKKIEAEALAQAKVENKSEVVVPVVNDIKTQRGDVATTTVKKVWKWELIDAQKIPREYLCPDPVKIGEAIRSGVREIEGVRIYQDEQISIR